MSSQTNNKRIAKNTAFLYFRMLFQLIVGLFTARIIFNSLGVVDYGIYGVVGGVVAMFSFINGSMATATMRFLTYELGKGNNTKRLREVFSTAQLIHIGLALLLLLLAETIGLWYIYNGLVYPVERQTAVLWLFQFSIITTMLDIVSVPYNAAVISHEKMSAFAYISIYETLANVAIIMVVKYASIDKLILYGLLVMLLKISVRLIYGVYCKRHFMETSGKYYFNKPLFKEMLKFAIWIINGCIALMAYTQGLNLLLNSFFGPTVNAARAVATNIQSKVTGFCNGFQMASNPQITKNYSSGNITYMHKLVFNTSKFSVWLLFFLSLPIILECPLILKVWLGDVPEETLIFVRLTLILGIVDSLRMPMNTSVHATGNIKKFQILEGTTLLLIVPIAYYFLKLGYPPYTVFVVQLIVFCLTQAIRVWIVCPLINMKKMDYLRNVILGALKVILPAMIIPIIMEYSINDINQYLKFFVVCVSSVISTAICVYYIGLDDNLREKIITVVQKKITFRKK